MNEATLEPLEPEAPAAPAAPAEDLNALWETAEPIAPEPADPGAPEDLNALWEQAEPLPLEEESPASRTQRLDVESRASFAGLPGVGVDDEQDAFLRALVRSLPPATGDRAAGVAQVVEQLGVDETVAERHLPELQALAASKRFDPKKWRLANPDKARLFSSRARSGLDAVVYQDEMASVVVRALRGVGAVLEGGIEGDQIPWYIPAGPVRTVNQTLEGVGVIASGDAAAAMETRRIPTVNDARAREVAGMGVLGRVGATWDDSRRGARQSSLLTQIALGRLARQDMDGLEAELADLQTLDAPRVHAQSDLEQLAHDIAETGASQVDQVKGAGAGAAVAGVGAGAVALAASRNPIAAGAAALVTGAKVGSTVATFEAEFGSTYGAIRNTRTEDGRLLDEDLLIGVSMLAAGGKAAIETLSFGAATKAAGPAAEALAKGGPAAAAKALLASPAGRAAARRIVKAWGEHAGSESLEEFAQNYVDEAAKPAALTLATGALHDLDPGHFERGVDVMGKTAVGVGPVAAVGAGVSAGANKALGALAKRNEARILGAVDREMKAAAAARNASSRSAEVVAKVRELADSPTAQASPAAAAELIASATADAGEKVESLFVDAGAVQRWFQDNEGDPAELLGPDHAQRLQEAITSGAKLEIPVAEYLKSWAGHDSAEELSGHVATRPGHATPAETKLQDEELAKPPEGEGEKRAIAAWTEQLKASGIHKAGDAKASILPLRQGLRTLAERTGQKPDALFEQFAIRVEAQNAARAPAPAPKGEAAPAAKVKARKEASAALAARGPVGFPAEVITPQRPQGEAARYQVIEADSLIASHDAENFQPRADYPAGVQEREYHRQAEEQAKVALGAQNLNPALLLADTPTAVDGPPLVTAGARAVVLGGNGRSMMLLRGMKNPATAAAYREALAAKAAAFGVDPAALAGMRSPVLVRVLADVPDTASQAELVAAVRRTNEGMTQALSPRARAVAEGKNLSPETIKALAELLASESDASLRELMRDRAQVFIEALRRDGVISSQNASSWTAGGLLTDEAKDRVEGMFLGLVVGSGDRMAATAPAVLAKLERVTPHLLRVAGINQAMDEIPTVQAALDLLNDARRRSLPLRDVVHQQGLFQQDQHPPAVVRLAQLLEESKPRDLAARFAAWADLAAFDPRQVDMFRQHPTADQVRQKLLGEVVVGKHEQGALVLYQPGLPDGPTPASEGKGAASERALADFFASRGEDLQHRDYWTDYNTGLYNERAVAKMPVDPALPFLASIDVDGKKAVNDFAGHPALDALLRATAQAVHGLAPWAGKLGGGIVVPCRDAAHAKQIAQTAQERLAGVGGDPRFKLFATAAKRVPDAPIRSVMDAIDAAGRKPKDRARENGTFATRGDAPVAFLPKDADGKPIASPVNPETRKVEVPEDVKAALRAALEPMLAVKPLAPDAFPLAPHLREASTALGMPEVAAGTYIDPETGLYTLDGWERLQAAKPREWIASIDMAFLRDLDGAFGREATDQLITQFGRALAKHLHFDFARLHGDEYAARGDNEAELRAVVAALKAELHAEMLFLTGSDGSITVQRGLYFGAGIAKTYPEADGPPLEADKAKEKQGAPLPRKFSREEADDVRTGFLGRASDLGKPLAGVGPGLAPDEGTGGAPAGPRGLRGQDLRRRLEASHGAGLADGERPAGASDPTRLNAGDPASPRGFMERSGQSFRIVLTPQADLSTFLHESGHVFLELFRDLAARPDAPQQIRDDYAAALKWLGVASGDEIVREHHEKWARGFEAYLMEGKEPSRELAGAFGRFRRWLTAIYKSAASLNVELSDEVRGVFDRILATDAQIEKAKTAMGAPMFRSAEEAGMTPEEFKLYLDEQVSAEAHVARRAELQMMKEVLREKDAAWQEEEAKLVEEAGREYEALPARRAALGLRGQAGGANGAISDLGVKIHLDHATVVAAVGEQRAGAFLTEKDGVSPDAAASLFGYETGAQLLEAVAGLPEKGAFAADAAKARMEERHPTLLADRAKLKESIEQDLHGERNARWFLRELQALRARAGLGAIAAADIQKAAAAIAAGMPIGKLNASLILSRERSAAESAAKAAARGRFGQAAAFKLQQLLNQHLFREVTAAREEREGLLELGKELGKPKARERLGLAGAETAHPNALLDGADTILEALGLREAIEREATPSSLRETIDAVEATGTTITFDAETIDKILAKPRPWGRLTVAEMRQVRGALEGIQAAARAATTAIRNGKRIDKAEAIALLRNEAIENKEKVVEALASSEPAETFRERVAKALNSIDGMLRKPGEMILRLGGANLHSAWYELVVKPLQEAKYREADLLKKTVKPILDAFDAMPKAVRNGFMSKIDGKTLFPNHRVKSGQSVRPPGHLFELLVMVLNAGNESNLERLLEGRNITMEELQAAIDKHVTKEMLDWVQSVWDASEGLWPEVAALEKRTTGLAPKKIELRQLRTAHGVYRGGYYPAIYDRRLEVVGQKQATNVNELLDPGYSRPGTSHSHTESRVDNFSGAIELDPNMLPIHLAKVVHDIAYREALQSVGGLVLHGDVQAVLQDHLGHGQAKQFIPWLQDVGQQRSMDAAVHAAFGMKVIRAIKGNTVTAVLGYSAQTALGDFSTLAAAVFGSKLRTRHWAAGLAEYSMAPLVSDAFAHEKSGELRSRRDQLQRELSEQVKKFTSSGALSSRALAEFKAKAFVMMEFSDRATSVPIWLGAYRQALADGESDGDAVTFADAQIHRLFPGHSAVDRAAVLRDKGYVGTSLMFYGFFNVAYNVQASLVDTILGPKAGALEKTKAAGMLLGYLVATGAVAELLSGRGPAPPEDEDEEPKEAAVRWGWWLLRKISLTSLASVPFGGDLGNQIERRLLGQQSSPRNLGLASVAYDLGDALLALKDDDKDLEQKVVGLLRAAQPIVGIPTAQPLRTGQALVKAYGRVQEGEPAFRDPFDAASKLTFGDRENQGANPLSLISDALQE